VEILRELLTRGASVHARNSANNTPLFLARRTANRECVELLEGAGGHLWMDERARSGASTPKTADFPLSRPISPGM
jgi:60kDa lysophospholipase